ncbi:hypothetical protein EVAR_56867_1 [Eumeta japonica]|uniref:Uncharacterized protein n=1 Tax=Eumeta variegata TaxID=151549 RepID=A0A4C1ZAR3_EUMVA|nr:hypothetical protein EVAR_56867_1 [Eumeta japonica]
MKCMYSGDKQIKKNENGYSSESPYARTWGRGARRLIRAEDLDSMKVEGGALKSRRIALIAAAAVGHGDVT